jgi:hypothetical protein
MTGDYFEDVLTAYFQGQRDGYSHALNDVENVLDKQAHQWADITPILKPGMGLGRVIDRGLGLCS